MRVGIATGEATESDGDFFGDPVVEAARLCAAGRGRPDPGHRCGAGGGRPSRRPGVGGGRGLGVEGPARSGGLCRGALGARSTTERRRSRCRPAWRRGPGIGFVGRAEELGVLAEVWKEAAHRAAAPLGVGGRGAGDRQVRAGRACSPGPPTPTARWCSTGAATRTLGIPYQPWAEAVAHLVDHAPPGLLDEVLAAHGAVLARLGPGLAHLGEGSGGGSADPETARYLLFGAVLRVLQAAGGGPPGGARTRRRAVG